MFDENKYRPKTVSEIIYGNSESKTTIQDVASGVYPIPFFTKNGILFYGVWGTGKTTLAKMMPDAIETAKTGEGLVMPETFIACQQGLNGPQVMTMIDKQLNVTSLNGSGYHYFVLDEVDNLTAQAQQSLKSAMNTTRGIFILTTNHISKLDKGFMDRCIPIEMNAASLGDLLLLGNRIAADLEPHLDTREIIRAAQGCNGSIRKLASNILFEVMRKRKALALQAATDKVIEAA